MNDLINRQQAIDEISRWLGYLDDDMIRRIQIGLRKLPSVQHVANDTNVGDAISRKGVFIPNITVEMFRNASLEGVEDLMVSGEMEDISLPSAQPKQKWIPCSERCPKENGYYLTSTVNKEVYCDYWSYDHFDRTEAVVAWMRLPEAYAERRTDE